MKALLISAIVAAICCVEPAFCDSYLALDYNHVSISGATLNGVDAGIGYKFGKYLDFEGGFQGAYKGKQTFNGGYLDAIAHIPLGKSGFSAFVSGGGAFLSETTPIKNGFMGVWGSGYRASAGVDYSLSASWSIRAAYRYQTAVVKMTSETLGLTFSF